MKLSEIAARLNCVLEGDGGIEITGVAGMEHAGASELTFLSNPKYAPRLRHTRAAAVLVAPEVNVEGRPALRTKNPYLAFAQVLEFFYQPPRPAPGIHPSAAVSAGARIGANASIGAFVFIDSDVEIGANTVLHSHVSIYRGARIGDDFLAHSHSVVREFCRIGNRVVLQNSVIIGGDGFGFAHRDDGSHYKIPQAGIVVIEDDVEIQAQTCVDRATVGETRVKRGAKIDNHVQIGHACVVGENDLICAQVGLAGSTELGKNVVFAGAAASAGHLKVGDGAVLTARAAIHRDVAPGQRISGTPGLDSAQWLKCVAAYNKLPELVETVRVLKKEIAVLKGNAERGTRNAEHGK